MRGIWKKERKEERKQNDFFQNLWAQFPSLSQADQTLEIITPVTDSCKQKVIEYVLSSVLSTS